ncbi:MAG: ATP-binding protein [Candidatus Tectimicrobiota bacterium]
MEHDPRLALFRRYNPFTSSSVGDPWEATYPDVPSINGHAFRGLCQLIEQKTTSPALNCAGLILGEVGSGKTHLLGRLLTQSKQTRFPFAFAYIQPLEDPEQTYRYLLREVMINLFHPLETSPQATQFRRLVTRVVHEGSASTPLARRTGITPALFVEMQQRAIQRLSTAYPAISVRFLQMLFHYAVLERRAAAMSWLMGRMLDEADAAVLHVPDRARASVAMLEEEARDILVSLGLLLMRYRQPLVICFDRLENLETDEQIHALGKMIEFLVDKAQAMLPIACFRGMQWEEKFRHKLNQHVSSRLETNKFELRGCTPEQAVAIVQSRLAVVPGYQATDALFPFDQEDLLKTFHLGLYSPRRVITLANQRLREMLDEEPQAPPSALEKLQEAFAEQYQAIVQDFERYQPDRGRLRRALELYVQYGPPHCTPLESGQEKYIDFATELGRPEADPIAVAFCIDVEQHHAAVGACLARGVAFLEEEPSGRVLYIRDARCPFPPPPAWEATNKRLQHFKALGGQVLFLDGEQAARWYALALLSYAVKEQDITVAGRNSAPRPVTFEEFATFIARDMAAPKTHTFQDIDTLLHS